MPSPGPPSSAGADAVEALLADAHLDHRRVDHAPTYTAMADAEASGLPAARVAKTVVTVDRDVYRLAVVPASRHVELGRMRDVVHASQHLRLATEDEIAARFPQFEPGAVPPLGRLLGVDEVIDPLLLHEPELLAPGGDHAHGFVLDPGRLAEAAGAEVADICEHSPDDRAHRFRDSPLR